MKAIGIAIVFVVALFVFPNVAHAQFLPVDCTGQNPFAFPSISAALLNVTGPGAFIAVTGPCNENVFINGAVNLDLGAFFGQTVTLNGNLSINNSQNVFVFGLNVTNSFGNGIDVNSSRSVVLDSCTSNGNAGNGMSVGQSSDVAIIATGAFSNNGGNGMFITSNSFVNVFSFAGTTDISNNHIVGMFVSQANFQTLGGTHMANNGSAPGSGLRVAIDVRGGGKVQFGSFSFAGGLNVIENNPNGGVSLQENAEISFFSFPPNAGDIVRNNGAFGIEAGFGSQVTLAGAQVTGHTGPGVDIYAHSQLYGTSQIPGIGATQILNNGTAGDPLSAAIRVDGNSETLLRGVTISQNNGPAILALVNSSADFAGNTLTGNGGVITCDSTSTMVSDLAIPSRTPAAGVSCTTAHTLGNRAVSVPTPAVPDVSVWEKLHNNYQQRSAARK